MVNLGCFPIDASADLEEEEYELEGEEHVEEGENYEE